ncbi:MAG: D-alanine--D-alanine ligase [Thermovirgaceae bacterium]|nr:D-alanine--D-alanine ligase [Thermovirgaceae bacterium]
MRPDRSVAVVAGREDTDREDVLDVLRCRQTVIDALCSRGFSAFPIDITRDDFSRSRGVARKILSASPSCVFNLFEGFSDASWLEIRFADILQSLGIPFTGNRSETLALCLDKDLARRTLGQAGLPVAPGRCVLPDYGPDVAEGLLFPLFVKPRMEDSSVGIDSRSVVDSPEELFRLLDERLASFPDGLIVEEFLEGREFNAGFLGSYPYELMAVSSIDFNFGQGVRPFLGYDSKWEHESSDYKNSVSIAEEGIDPKLRKEIVRISREAGKIMGCRGYFRVDLREHRGRLFVLEVNPNPDINTDSGFAKQSARRGYGYAETAVRLVRIAMNGRPLYEEKSSREGIRVPASGGKDGCLLEA